MNRISRRVAAGAAALIVSTGVAAAPVQAAESAQAASYGAWVSNFPCLFTDPPVGTSEFACVGSNDWAGTLNAVTYFTGKGTYDVVTQGSKGTFDEQAVLVALDGTHGTLQLLHQFEISPVGDGVNALQITSVAKVVDGTGGFKDARGTITFNGVYSYLCCGTGVFNSPAGADETQSKQVRGTMSGKITVPDGAGSRRTIPV